MEFILLKAGCEIIIRNTSLLFIVIMFGDAYGIVIVFYYQVARDSYVLSSAT